MVNQEIAKIFFEIGEFLEIQGVKFKPTAYQKAAINLDALEKSVKEIFEQQGNKGLEEIPGIGKSMAEKIEEYLNTGKIEAYDKLKK